jgi:hypothetical protein
MCLYGLKGDALQELLECTSDAEGVSGDWWYALRHRSVAYTVEEGAPSEQAVFPIVLVRKEVPVRQGFVKLQVLLKHPLRVGVLASPLAFQLFWTLT